MKTEVKNNELIITLTLNEAQTLTMALEDLEYLRIKNRLYLNDTETSILKDLKSGPIYGMTHRNN